MWIAPVTKSLLLRLLLLVSLFASGSFGGPSHELVASFERSPQYTAFDAPTPGSDGYYWRTTQNGGIHGLGTICKVKTDGSESHTVLSFTGMERLTRAPKPEQGW